MEAPPCAAPDMMYMCRVGCVSWWWWLHRERWLMMYVGACEMAMHSWNAAQPPERTSHVRVGYLKYQGIVPATIRRSIYTKVKLGLDMSMSSRYPPSSVFRSNLYSRAHFRAPKHRRRHRLSMTQLCPSAPLSPCAHAGWSSLSLVPLRLDRS